MAIIDVIKYNGTPDVFAWKYPSDELSTWTQLIINESQEAILYKGGQALDLFLPGRHVLETANIPILNKIINIPFGGKSPFKAEVWYINKAFSLDIKWGTPTPIQLQDPKYKIFVAVRSFGQFGIQISDSRKFLTKLVGTLPVFDKDALTKFFKGIYLTKVKDTISTYLVKKSISILEVNAYLDELSEHLMNKIVPTLEEYGIKLLNFYVNDINVPEDDPAIKKLKEALAKKAEMDIVGYDYVKERSFNTLENAANNPGSMQSDFMGAGMGLGMGLGMQGEFFRQFRGMTQDLSTKNAKTCPQCQSELDSNKRFCATCGYDTQSNNRPSSSANSNVICSNCKNTFSINSKFCPECGNPYNPCHFCGADLKDGTTQCEVCGKAVAKPCPKCGKIMDDKAKFCPECGESFIKTCPSCGKTVDGSPKFCPECGSKL